jgi:hypothetical protein
MIHARVILARRSLFAQLARAVAASLLFSGCGAGETQEGAPTPEDMPKRAKYQDLHPTAPLKKPTRVKPPSSG